MREAPPVPTAPEPQVAEPIQEANIADMELDVADVVSVPDESTLEMGAPLKAAGEAADIIGNGGFELAEESGSLPEFGHPGEDLQDIAPPLANALPDLPEAPEASPSQDIGGLDQFGLGTIDELPAARRANHDNASGSCQHAGSRGRRYT